MNGTNMGGADELVELGRRRLVVAPPLLLGVVVVVVAEAPEPPQRRLHRSPPRRLSSLLLVWFLPLRVSCASLQQTLRPCPSDLSVSARGWLWMWKAPLLLLHV